MRFLKLFSRTAVAVLLFGIPSAYSSAVNQPNIVFILVDDLGFADFGCYGSHFNETPNIDRLPREGLKFNTAYSAAPICSPTRASFMTGQYSVRSGITDFIKDDAPDVWLEPGVRRSAPNTWCDRTVHSRGVCRF